LVSEQYLYFGGDHAKAVQKEMWGSQTGHFSDTEPRFLALNMRRGICGDWGRGGCWEGIPGTPEGGGIEPTGKNSSSNLEGRRGAREVVNQEFRQARAGRIRYSKCKELAQLTSSKKKKEKRETRSIKDFFAARKRNAGAVDDFVPRKFRGGK